MSCNHLDPTAETNMYHEGSLVCTSCGLELKQGQLVSESPRSDPHHAPLTSSGGYDRSIFFLAYIRKHHGVDLSQDELHEAVRVYRRFAACFVSKIRPFVKRRYILPNSYLAHRIINDVLGIPVPDDRKCRIKTPRILTDFGIMWDFFLSGYVF
jgi:hypothetical protein